MKKLLSTILAGCMLGSCIIPVHSGTASDVQPAPQSSAEYVQGTLLFVLPETDTLSALDEDLKKLGLSEIEPLFTENGKAVGLGENHEIWYRAAVSGDVPAAVEAVSALTGVICAEPEYIYTSDNAGEPAEIECQRDWTYDRLHKHDGKHWWRDDAYLGHNDAPGTGTIVAVIDTGVDYTHEDLKANMWINYAEMDGTEGVDDDGNGYIDDIYGVNVTADGAAAGNPMDDNGHGTHVAGIIAMSANEKGGVGLAYGAEIMAIKAGQSTGSFASADIAKAVNYAVMMGADVINMSFGGTGKSYLVETALQNAFATCVLVASAGNDELPTTDADPALYPKREDIYPAGYSYVLGVMATGEDGSLASFSNWDYNPNKNAEYELTAPGVGIYSTLPGNRYASWNGTSMAAPFVSAAAAILRSHFQDKDMYSSRFIMGQLSSATEDSTYFEAPMRDKVFSYPALNVYDSIVNLPRPNITVKDTFLMDNVTDGTLNDGDAIIEAGETIDLGVLVRNQWGLTGEITVKADALSVGGVANPYITFVTDEITLEPAGTFQESDNGFVYNDSYLEAVSNPIRFVVAADTPNDAEICINLTVTTTNGADASDTAEYYSYATHTFRVQAGRGVQGTITEDTTWTSDYLWIVENSVYIPEGVTLTVEPGTRVQFYSSDYEDAYGMKTVANIVNDGTLNMIGTEDEPIELFPGKGFEQYVVEIYGEGVETLEYCNVVNPYFGRSDSYGELAVNRVDHCSLTQNMDLVYHRYVSGSNITSWFIWSQYILQITNTQLNGLRRDLAVYSYDYDLYTVHMENCVLNGCRLSNITTWNVELPILQNNVFLKGDAGGSHLLNTTYSNMIPSVIPDITYTVSQIITNPDTGRKYARIQLSSSGNEMEYDLLNAAAKSLGGTTASINDEEEEAFLTNILSINTAIGCRYNLISGRYEWADGNPYVVDIVPYNNNMENFGLYYNFVWIIDSPKEFKTYSYIDESFGILLEFPADVSDEDINSLMDTFDYEAWVAEHFNRYQNNAILNPLLNNTPDTWTRFRAGSLDHTKMPNYLTGNYWGTENQRLINHMIIDGDDYAGTYQNIIHDPILTLESESLAEIYPFVTEIYLQDSDGNTVTAVQPGQTYEVHVLFNRDMDRTVQPSVTYGGEAPYTDYTVNGDFVSDREWIGTTTVSPVMNSGTMYFRTAGGCAADDGWLVCGEDVLRFSFEVNSVGVMAMMLSAEGGTGKVTLSWAQNDYDVLAGYNLYRSTDPDAGFEKLNTSVLTGTGYEDTDVEPGVLYYYYFKVVNTEGNEEENVSNTASAAPVDDIDPVLAHSVITAAKMNTQITVSADATDNIGVTAVMLYYRTKGAATYKSVKMVNTTDARYAATIPAAAVTADGVEYFVTAADEDGNIVHSGTEQLPHYIGVNSAPAITGVTPQQLSIHGGQTVTILGVNFTGDMTLRMGETEITDFTVVDSGQITFTAPAMDSGRYVLVLTTADGRTAAAREQLICSDASSVAQIPTNMEMFSGVEYTIPFIAAADSGVYSIHFELDLPSAYFQNIRVEKADAEAAFTLDYNYSNGILLVSCIGVNNIITQNALVNVMVTPIVSEQMNQTVSMHDVRFNGADVNRVISGTAKIFPVFKIDAEVTHWGDSHTPVEGTVIKADGQSAVTDENGRATLTVSSQHVDITATSTAPIPSGAISAYDASLVLQYSVGKITLNEYQMIAGDVTGDGRVDESDASSILQMAVRKISVFPCGVSWKFTPASVSKELNVSTNSVEFTAICMGDVDGSAGEE